MKNTKTTVKDLRDAVRGVWTNLPAEEAAKLKRDELEWLLEVAACFATKKQQMAEILARYRAKYETCATASGRTSKRCGDEVSVLFTGLDQNQAALFAELALGLELGELREKYGHLNNGQIRMNSSNRVRGAIKRGDLTVEDLTACYKTNAKLLTQSAAA